MKKTLTILAFVLAASTSVRAEDLVPYGTEGWRYRQVSLGDPLEDVFHDPTFDDSAWPEGTAGFGTVGGTVCPVLDDAVTPWDVGTHLLVRREFDADPQDEATVFWAVDNAAKIWVNGVVVAEVSNGGCTSLDQFSAPVPANVLKDSGNVLAVLARDWGGVTFFDLRLTGGPLAVESRSWGALKSRYR